ncbi:MAG: PAS domain-containing protein [Cyanobacteria bacterium P01_H01_bin.162]
MSNSPVVVLTIASDAQKAAPAFLTELAEQNYIVHRVTSPTAAAAEVTQLWASPTATIILDCAIACPQLMATLEHLTSSATAATPVVIMMGVNDAELAVQAMKAGASDYWVRDRVTADQVKSALTTGKKQPESATANPANPPAPTERQPSEFTAQQQQQRFQLMTETIQDVFWIADFRIPQVFYVSPAYADIWGRSPEAIYQNYDLWADTLHPDDRERVLATAAQSIHQDGVEQEYRIVRPDGSIRWIRDRGFAVKGDNGEFSRMVGIAQDITERKCAAAALVANESRLQAFVESNVVGIIYCDIHGNIFQANDELLRIVGYSSDDLAAKRLQWIDMTPPEYLPLDEQRIAEAQARGACTPYEKEYIRKDGQRVPVLIGYTLLGEQREEAVVFVLDLSSRKKAERALRRSKDRLRMALDSAQLGTWDWHFVNNELVWDDRCKAIFGLVAEATVTIERFFQALHPDDRERLQQEIATSLNPASGNSYASEYRVIRFDDGAERWIMAKGQMYFADDGTAQRFIGTVMDITERKQTETALRDSQERLQMAIAGSGSGFWDWQITTNEDYLSPEWLYMLGFETGGLPDKYSSWEQLIHPDDKPMVMEKLYAHLQDGQHPYQFEYRLMTKSGDWKWIANYGKVVKRDEAGKPLRMAGIHLDISDRKRAQAQSRLSETRYRTLANAVSQLMWISQASGQIEFFNAQWHDYTGLTERDFAIGAWPEVIHPEDIDTIQTVQTAAIAGKIAYEVEARVKRHDQLYRWHLARVVPLMDDTGAVVNWYGTATDIHDRKLAAAEREQFLAQEQAARAAAEQANRVKDDFLAILSHELRSPLNPILGWSQLLRTRELDRTTTLQAVSTIERNVKLQTQLIDDLLDIAKILRGKLKLAPTRVDLALVVNGAIETVQTAAAAKAITIKPDLQAVGHVWGDEGRLQQIVWNLLSNAIKFTPEAGQITISLTQTEAVAQIEVTDTGKGIQPEFLPHIFESFRQEDVSITREYGGLGLGLAIVRYLTEANGGQITADSQGIGQGATFTVALPLLPVAVAAAPTHSAAVHAFDLSHVRILAVDDDPDCRDLIATILKEYQAEVLTVASAQEALAQFHTFKPDILISDLGMPQLDGYSLIKQIRSLSERSGGQVPAIALTAYTRAADQQKSLAHGFQRHVAKPIEIEGLIQTIFELVNAPTDNSPG